jgi:hypothetical protein
MGYVIHIRGHLLLNCPETEALLNESQLHYPGYSQKRYAPSTLSYDDLP